ncbi:FHA domain-containing protein [Microbacterium sp. YMB-B2]|uniref:FHA domain-containing protein n=1 Tax=Microbacterium tenebrionis TaxID=2830665 RepID=A0A9X1LNB0_9MICO|nr:FHA domain-containing protein [Microbacterium tenebrionis]MCC2028742.1 FHA domain-containing protein [Microbacterium tenebrionis]
MQTAYRPGQWYTLVAPGALIALAPEAPAELVQRLWERQSGGSDLAAVIDALTEHAGGSFTAMLPFAAIVLEGPNARIAVRGDVTVRVEGEAGAESFTGSNVTTWSERFVAGASRVAVAAGDDADDMSLPIAGGIVRAAEATAEIESSDIAALEADAAPEMDAAPEADAAPKSDAGIEADAAVAASAPEAIESEPAEESEPADVAAPVDEPAAEPETEPMDSPVAEAEDAAESEPEVVKAPEPADEDDAVNGATLTPDEVTYASDADEFEQLFGATIAGPRAPAAPPMPPAPAAAAGDHDGETISVAEAHALRQNAPTAGPDAPTAVLPVVSGGAGRVRVSTGQVMRLDRTVIIGRRPRSTRASGADMPHLVAVESPQQDISRSHLEIRPEGDTVVVVDLHTTNGSTLLRPGADPLRLHPGEQTLVLSGDVVDLGDGVTVVFEDLP